MDYSSWGFWLAAAQAVGAVIVGAIGALLLRMRKSESRVEAVDKQIDRRLDDIDSRLTRVEGAIEHGPKREDLGRIHTRIDEVAAAIARIEGESHTVARNVDLIHQHLLERGP